MVGNLNMLFFQWLELLGPDDRFTSSCGSGPRFHTRGLMMLGDDSEAARRRKDFAPFAGILTREERREVILSCSFDH
jgi:hypothetical protein